MGSACTGLPFGASVSPVTVPDSFDAAARSPATTASTRLLLVAPDREQAVEPLVGAGAGVDEVVVGADRARQHLEQRDVADELVGDGLEHERQRLPVGVGRDLRGGRRRPRR